MNKKTQPDWSVYKEKGYMGLANLGNTCFMNSCLQVLNHTYELNDIFLVNNVHKKMINTKKKQELDFVHEWVELQKMMWSNKKGQMAAISPNKFVQSVQNLARIKNCELFTGWAQNDMPEFLQFMIDTMHNSISRNVKMRINGSKKNMTDDLAITCYEMLQSVYTKEYSEVMDLFYGIYVSILRPIHGEAVSGSKTPEMFFVLNLPIPNKINTDPTITLYQCFDLFTEVETLDGDNAWLNEKTNQKESVTKQIQFWNLPRILVIVLKRFQNDGIHKRQDLVDFPLNDLNLSKYICGYNPMSYVYDLYGVCNHMGGIMGGHYNCHVKNADNEWIHYNDTNSMKIGSHASVTNKIVTPYAYCLFYRKRYM